MMDDWKLVRESPAGDSRTEVKNRTMASRGYGNER